VTSEPIRWGILSTALINDELLPGFEALANAELVAVASRTQERATAYAAATGIPRAHGSYDALLADPEIDAVYISLPNSLHHVWTLAALQAGKHVLCEKPLTLRSAEAMELFARARELERVLMEAFMYRHHPQTAKALQLIGDGAIGEVQAVRSSFSFTVADPATDIRMRSDLGGGALLDLGCYCIGFARLVAGEEPVEAMACQILTRSGVDERTYGMLRFPSGITGLFDVSLRAPLDYGFTVIGRDGVLDVPTPWYAHEPPQRVTIQRGDGSFEAFECPGRNSYELEIENLGQVIRGESAPTVSEAFTVGNLRAIELVQQAASTRAVAS
jgi:xylose dehydrogenase (NAD/NADP)